MNRENKEKHFKKDIIEIMPAMRFSFVNPVGGRWFQAAPGGVSGAVFQ